MALKINRAADSRVIRPIASRILGGDIPGGVAIDVSVLGGTYLKEGTPVGKGSNGLYNVIKTAKVVTEASDSETAIEVAKGHQFKVGDYLADTVGGAAYAITNIDKVSSATKDTITVGTTLGATLEVGSILFESGATGAAAAAYKYAAIGIVGDTQDIVASSNLFSDVITHGVVIDANTVPTTAAIKALMPGIVYI